MNIYLIVVLSPDPGLERGKGSGDSRVIFGCAESASITVTFSRYLQTTWCAHAVDTHAL